MKILLPLFLSLLSTLSVQAQIVQDYEPAMLEVYYSRRIVLDTLRADAQFRVDDMMLRLGQKHALWVAPKRLWADSLMAYNFPLHEKLHYQQNPIGGTGKPKPLGGYHWEYIFKNMPEGKNTIYNYFNLEHRIYEEDIETPEWELVDSTKMILGYECSLARTAYRGRQWEAWYSPEIALQEGPWKLRGLPGLILEAYDTKGHYTFTAQGMNTNGLSPVGIYLYKKKYYMKMTRDSYFKAWYGFITSKESLADKLIKSGAFGIKPGQRPMKVKREKRAYDFEETDYPH